jgi:hypothetical protein
MTRSWLSMPVGIVVICGLLSNSLPGEQAKSSPEKRIIAAQFGQIDALLVRDGFVCWTEKKLDPATIRNRVQTFWYRLYRAKLDGSKVESLGELKASHPVEMVLGEAGVVAWGVDYPSRQVFVPGRDAIDLPQKNPDGSRDTPREVTRDSLICHTVRGKEEGVTVLPWKDGALDSSRQRALISWYARPAGLSSDISLREDFFVRGNYLVLTEEPRNAKGSLSHKPRTVVWDVEAKRVVWMVDGRPLGIDDHPAFVITRSGVHRRPLDGKGPGESMALGWLHAVIDVRLPKLLALIQHDNERVPAWVDLGRGTRYRFEVKPPMEEARRRFHGWTTGSLLVAWGNPKRWQALAGDATTGTLLVGRADGIHQLPRNPDVEPEQLRWE